MHGGPAWDDSHMEIQVEGKLMESGGNHNNVGGAPQGATALDNPEWTDYWYLPGPIIENTLPTAVTQPPVVTPTAPPDYLRLVYEQLLGPVGTDGYGHGWPQLGTDASGANLTLVQFLAKYKPALDALLAKAPGTTAETVSLTGYVAEAPPTPQPRRRSTVTRATKALAPKAATPAKKDKATPPAAKTAARKATPKKK